MGPQDTLTLVVSVILVIGAVVGCLLLWARIPGPAVAQVAARLGLIVLCQITALALVGLLINNARDFYGTWSDLAFDWGFGGDVNSGPGHIEGAVGPGHALPRIRADFHYDGSRKTYTTTITGPASRVSGRVVVWLPPQYKDPRYKDTRFPVIELFSGTPGEPTTWFGDLDGGNQLVREMALGQAKPFILVSPAINVAPRPTECTDVPHGPQVATWLSRDVRQLMSEYFRVDESAQSWGTMGYSEGAYCATKLALQYPQLFHAGVGIAGTYEPTLPEVLANPALRQANSPLDLLRRDPPVNLLLATTGRDPEAPPSEIAKVQAAAHPPTRVDRYVLPNGSHLTAVWRSMLPTIYAWISKTLVSPL